MQGLPKSAQIYIASVTVVSIGVLSYYTIATTYNHYSVQGLIFFGILAIFTDLLKVNLPKGGYVTVTFAVLYACTLLFGTGVAGYVIIIGLVFGKLITRDKSPWYKLVFNCGQYIICIAVSHLVYVLTG